MQLREVWGLAGGVAFGWLLVACGTDNGATGGSASPDSSPEPKPLCDDSDELRLRFGSGGGFVSSYYGFLNPLGAYFLLIDGQCRYWVGSDVWLGAREGTLSEEQAARIEADVHYAGLAEIEGAWTSRGCMDGGTWRLSDGAAELSCYCGCSDEDVPPAVAVVGQAVSDIAEDLLEMASPFAGPIQVAALDLSSYEEHYFEQFDWQPWPLARSVSDVVVASEPGLLDPEIGLRFVEPAELETLRALRDEYVAEHGPIYDSDDGFLPITADGSHYALVMRDVIPWDPAAP